VLLLLLTVLTLCMCVLGGGNMGVAMKYAQPTQTQIE
jgi:hypothetical protein